MFSLDHFLTQETFQQFSWIYFCQFTYYSTLIKEKKKEFLLEATFSLVFWSIFVIVVSLLFLLPIIWVKLPMTVNSDFFFYHISSGDQNSLVMYIGFIKISSSSPIFWIISMNSLPSFIRATQKLFYLNWEVQNSIFSHVF